MSSEFNEYQGRARETAVYPNQGTSMGIAYCALGLAGEAGEVADNIKKYIRDDNEEISIQRMVAITKELGDVLWYIANLATELNLDLGIIADENLRKLADRKNRGTIHGSGDNR